MAHAFTMADVIRRSGAAYRARYGSAMLPSHRRALYDLAACRTAALGGHVTQCDQCGAEHYAYQSCRNRSCPTCHGPATAAWLAAREPELLPVPYFHVVFTLPSELREIVRSHQRALLGALMTTAAESLQALAADPHYLGGTLGILAVLHTWTRALVYHPHVHCLIPGGALAPDGRTWRPARAQYLLPVRALSVGFRSRFLGRLKAALPEVVVPPTVWTKPWVVYAKPTVQGSALVLRYLGRYVHRVALTNARLVSVTDAQVTFRYRTHPGGWRSMTLPSDEFLRRFLQHVLPRGFHKVRYYGCCRPAATVVRDRVRTQVAPPTPTSADAPVVDAATAPLLEVRDHCPLCTRGTLHLIRVLPRPRRLPGGVPP
jgi:hypothetical protein